MIIELNQGARPRRPLDGAITDAQWAFMERCWSEIDNCRPQASFALKTVEKFLKDAMVSTSDLTDGNSMTVMVKELVHRSLVNLLTMYSI